jgi:hypothetical protein
LQIINNHFIKSKLFIKPKKEAGRMKLETERIVGEIVEDLEG